MKKRLLTLLLALSLCLSLAAPALAVSVDEDGFIISGGILVEYQGRGGNIIIPSGVTAIGTGAFKGCDTLRSVVIPRGVTYIGIEAFQNCIALSHAALPDTLEEIDNRAFSGCISLSTIDLPDSVTTMGEMGFLFSGCSNLKYATLSPNLARVPYGTFENCSSLLSVTVPGPSTVLASPFQGASQAVICGAEGSQAQTYARETGMAFSLLPNANPPTVSRFTDVPADSPYAAAILWAVEYGITTGRTASTFAPDAPCTVGQLLTFLWRANGSPKSNEANHFTDPIPEAYRMAAIWAYEMGLVSGPTLGADRTCTKETAIDCLWRLAGKPASFPEEFADIAADSPHHMAASWAVTNNITEPDANGRFLPGTVCTRGQALTYLYRGTQKGVPAPPSPGERTLIVNGVSQAQQKA